MLYTDDIIPGLAYISRSASGNLAVVRVALAQHPIIAAFQQVVNGGFLWPRVKFLPSFVSGIRSSDGVVNSTPPGLSVFRLEAGVPVPSVGLGGVPMGLF